jgi:hypothetical protein
MPALPLLALAVFWGLLFEWPDNIPRTVGNILLVAAVLAGMAVEYNGLSKMRRREEYLGTMKEMVSKTIPDDSIIVTDLWWAEQVIPDVFLRCRMFYIGTPESAEKLLSELLEKNPHEFWLLVAPETHGVIIEQAISKLGINKQYSLAPITKHSYHDLIIVRAVLNSA